MKKLEAEKRKAEEAKEKAEKEKREAMERKLVEEKDQEAQSTSSDVRENSENNSVSKKRKIDDNHPVYSNACQSNNSNSGKDENTENENSNVSSMLPDHDNLFPDIGDLHINTEKYFTSSASATVSNVKNTTESLQDQLNETVKQMEELKIMLSANIHQQKLMMDMNAKAKEPETPTDTHSSSTSYSANSAAAADNKQ